MVMTQTLVEEGGQVVLIRKLGGGGMTVWERSLKRSGLRKECL